MALFSRRRKDSPDPAQPGDATASAADEPVDAAADGGDTGAPPQALDQAPAETDAAASVGISVSSFRELGVPQPAAPQPAVPASQPAAAPAAPAAPEPVVSTASRVSSTAGAAFGASARPPAAGPLGTLPDNVPLRDALAALSEQPSPQEVMDVARQLLQGQLFLRIKGDARVLMQQGAELPLASATIGDRRFAVAYASARALGESVRLDGDTDSSAIAQPVLVVLRHMLGSPAEGLMIDPASAPHRVILPRDLIQQLVDSADEQLTLKTLLTGERTAETPALLAEALARTTTWAAVGQSDTGQGLGLAEGRSADGARYLEIYSHPIEVVAMGRGDRPTPVTPQQLAAAIHSADGLTGVVLDSRGPWMRLTRAELAPVLALAD